MFLIPVYIVPAVIIVIRIAISAIIIVIAEIQIVRILDDFLLLKKNLSYL